MIGSTIAQFRITAKLGKGGMGEVYRAEDTKLGREVALKVLPEAFVSDETRLARFEQEARVLARLSHPNIAAIHEVREEEGVHFLVMELAHGETLAERIGRGPIPIDESIPIGLQIAAALEAAHDRGVVHRDLKPANVMVGESRNVKVLDFGLAKALGPDPTGGADGEISVAPTVTYQATQPGAILGTAGYMSPEQARGKPVDHQTDIWAFGVLLWEMLTGGPPFEGETLSDTLASVLTSEPDLELLPKGTPRPVSRLIRRCLQKDPMARLQDIGDARLELEDAIEGETPEPGALPSRRRAIWLPAWAVVATVGFLLAGGLLWWSWTGGRAPVDERMVRFSIEPVTSDPPIIPDLALSPHDRYLAYSLGGTDDERIRLREIATGTTAPLPGTEGARSLSFSPDRQTLAFWAGGELRLFHRQTGRSERVALAREPVGLSWAPDGFLLFAETVSRGVMRTRIGTEGVERITKASVSRHDFNPLPLPGGERLLLAAFVTAYDTTLEVVSPGSGTRQTVIENATAPALLAPDVLVFQRDGWLQAVRFDPRSTRTLGSPVAVEGPVKTDPYGRTAYSVSSAGSLAYVSGPEVSWRTGVYDPDSRTIGELPFRSAVIRSPRVSPDGDRISVSLEEERANLWIYDLETGTHRQLTGTDSDEWWHTWIDDSRIAFQSNRRTGDLLDVYLMNVDEPVEPEMLVESSGCSLQPQEWVPTTEELLYARYCGDSADGDLWRVSLGDSEPQPLLLGNEWQKHPSVSPDGRWLVYAADGSGVDQVFVTTYPEPGRITQISAGGGWAPSWAPDGTEIVYETSDALVAVEFIADPQPTIGRSRTIYEGRFLPSRPWGRDYALMPNGNVLLGVPVADGASGEKIHVVINWRKKVEELLGE